MVKKRIFYSITAVIILVIVAFGVVQTNQLTDVQTTLAATQNELADTQVGLTKIKNALAEEEAALSKSRSELVTIQTDLADSLNELDSLNLKLETSFEQLDRAQKDYETASAALAAEEALALTLQNDIDNLNINISFLATGYGYMMRNQTYQTCKTFIATDQTDKREWVEGVYEGVNFAMDVKINAIKQKIRCGYVSVRLGGGGNIVLVVFETTDRGIIYIYPPSDEEVNLQVGGHFWTQCIIPSPGTYYISPSYNDIVERFNTTW
ncbi:MAG: hypothetical protein A2Y58_04635 [Chloroflexi bacterium RBG_13_51_52]|nr:MAG: hypothetical protein A2Y58_04635 [Chloroflexi bacterium RBG_13_51_52]